MKSSLLYQLISASISLVLPCSVDTYKILLFKSVKSVSGDSDGKSSRQVQAEDDDEKRFQADMKKAVLQSLGKISAT